MQKKTLQGIFCMISWLCGAARYKYICISKITIMPSFDIVSKVDAQLWDVP